MTEDIITWNLKLDKTIRFQHRHGNKKNHFTVFVYLDQKYEN